MRYFRVTLNPQSPAVAAGPGGNSVVIRLRFAASPVGPEQMLLCTWKDGDLIAVPDAEMGQFGGPTDNLFDSDYSTPYKMFQDTVPILLPEVLALIPLWTASLRPFTSNPAAQPTVWPALQVVTPG